MTGWSNSPAHNIGALLGVWRRQWRRGSVTDEQYRLALEHLARAAELELRALDAQKEQAA